MPRYFEKVSDSGVERLIWTKVMFDIENIYKAQSNPWI